MALWYSVRIKQAPEGIQRVASIETYTDGHPRGEAFLHSRNQSLSWPEVETGELNEDGNPVLARAEEAVFENGAIRAATAEEIAAFQQYDADKLAEAVQQQASFDAEQYGSLVTQLASLLATFSITMPVTLDEATPIIYAASKANPTLAADGVVLQTVYTKLLQLGLTDDRIFQAWLYLQG